ncbi:MAG: DUF1841 family protein [Mariprofundaceae bacterium]
MESSEEQLRAHRQVFWDAWSKAQSGAPMNEMEKRIAQCISIHPEYHPLFNDWETYLARAFTVDDGMNPYLHLSLHLAMEEQLATTQPPEAGQAISYLIQKQGMSRHDALHVLIETLAESVYHASRAGCEPDVVAYQIKLRDLMGKTCGH